MRYSCQRSQRPSGRDRPLATRGFAVYEVVLAVVVLMLAAGLLLSLYDRARQKQHCDQYIEDLQTFSAVIAWYHQENNRWPTSGYTGGNLPSEIETAFEGSNWHKSSPFGGNYEWVAPEVVGADGGDKKPQLKWEGKGAITLTAFSPSFPLTVNHTDLLYIDREIDDGDLTTGRFRTGFNGWPVYLVAGFKEVKTDV